MIRATINRQGEIETSLVIEGPSGQQQTVTGIIDTGFTGELTLPLSVISSLGLYWRTLGEAKLGNGRVVEFDIYSALVEWDGQKRFTYIEAAESDPLIGLKMLRGYKMEVDFTEGGSANLTRLP